MFQLHTARENRWLELPHGVKVEVRPRTTALDAATASEATRRLAAEQREADAHAAAGQPLDPAGFTVANEAVLNGLAPTQVGAIYGADPAQYAALTAYLSTVPGATLPTSGDGYVSSAQSRTLWVKLDAQAFQTLVTFLTESLSRRRMSSLMA